MEKSEMDTIILTPTSVRIGGLQPNESPWIELRFDTAHMSAVEIQFLEHHLADVYGCLDAIRAATPP